jgi:hypothetical protein
MMNFNFVYHSLSKYPNCSIFFQFFLNEYCKCKETTWCQVQTGSATHPVTLTTGYRGPFPRDKSAGPWIWPLTSMTEVKNMWRYTSTSPYVFMPWCLIEQRDYFTLVNVNSEHYKKNIYHILHTLIQALHYTVCTSEIWCIYNACHKYKGPQSSDNDYAPMLHIFLTHNTVRR